MTQLHCDQPARADLPALHELYSDPAVWQHYPSLRHTQLQQTADMLDGWITAWDRDGLGPWIVREQPGAPLLGHGGCMLKRGLVWNLGYRFTRAAQGKGYATQVAQAGIEAAHTQQPDVPVIALLLEHNVASRRVAEKCGLTLVDRALDDGNPDPTAIRLVLADRPLTPEQLRAAIGL